MADTEKIAAFDRGLTQNHGRNARYILLDAVFFGLGFSVFAPATILPGFIRHFTGNPVIINSIFAIFSAGLFGPQIISCWLHDSSPARHRPFMAWGFIYRFLVVLLVVPVTMSLRSPRLTLVLFLSVYALSMLSWGMSALLWQELIGRWLEPGRRSMVIGIRFFAEQISTLVGGIAVVAVMNHFVFPSNYLVIFSAGAACWWLCHLVLLRTRESVYPQVNTREHFVPFLRQLAAVAGRDRQFGRFLIFLILSSSSAMSLSLYTTVSMDAFLADATVMARDRYASICNVFLTGSFACGSLAAGALLRSRGFRPVMVVAAILCALGAVNACVAGNPAWFYMTFVLNGTSIGFFLVGMIEMLLAVTAPSQRLRYIAVANTTRGVFSMMFSLAGGLLTAAIGPKVTFAATAVLCFAAAVLLFGPECAPACERA